MTSLQVTCEIALDVDSIYNLDLFQKGWYKLKVNTVNEKCWETLRLPNGAKDKSAYFTEKYVRYRREEKSVAEQWLIRIHRLVPSEKIMGDQPLEIKINLNVELWFGETNDDQELVSSREIDFKLKPTCHDVITVTFEYGFMLSTRISIHGAITSIYQPYSREFMEPNDDGTQPNNSLESILTKGAASLDGIQLTDEMIKSYICTAHLRIIRQLNCTIRALREATRLINGTVDSVTEAFDGEGNGTSSPTPEQEITPKYVQNVMSKQSTNDIFSQTQVNIAQSCSRVLNAWNDFLDKYLKSKEWRQALAIKNKALRSERSLSTFLVNNNESRLNSTKYSVEDYDKFSLKILDSEFWRYLPRPNILIRETDGYDDEIPIIFKDNYAKNNILDIKDITINDSSDIKQTDQYIRNRRNPNDVDFEKEELRILTLSMDEPRDQSFIAHRAKDFSSLGIQGEFVNPPTTMSLSIDYLHLIVMVHGLEGNSNDLRLWKTGLEQLYPLSSYEFLLCTSNHNLTHESILDQGARITQEVQSFLSQKDKLPNKISFIGHSMGALLVRIAANSNELEPYRPLFGDFLSLCGPHSGCYYMDSDVVKAGLWFYEKWKKANSLKQLALRDSMKINETAIYKMAAEQPLGVFGRVLLVSATGDRYVSPHSARIEQAKQAFNDQAQGKINIELVEKLQRNLEISQTKVERYHVFHQGLPQDSASKIIGRAAHIAVLDSQLFINSFLMGSRAFCNSLGSPSKCFKPIIH